MRRTKMGKLIVVFTLTGCFLVSCSGMNKKIKETASEVENQVSSVADEVTDKVNKVTDAAEKPNKQGKTDKPAKPNKPDKPAKPKDEKSTDTEDESSSAIDDVSEDAGSGEEWKEFILPESSDRYLEDYELPVTKSELRIARNEIFARHGRIFKDKKLQEYFESTSWYEGTVKPEKFSEKVLNKFEKYNVALLAAAEKKAPDKGEKEIYFAGLYKAKGNATVEMEEYSSPDETSHGINAGYIIFSGLSDEINGKEIQIYRGDSKGPNYYEDYKGFISVIVKTDRIIINGMYPNSEDEDDSTDVSGTYYLKERFPMP